jgi:uncharacterized protein YdeI (YjbR/CyaY-like superfamily)
MTEETKGDLPVIPFETQGEWEEWLDENHASSPGLWLKLAKVDSGIRSVTYVETVDSALCYGWIDGQKSSYDEQYWLQRFTRRTPRSKWSKRNRERAAELIEQGKMKPAGLHEIERAKRDGRWSAAYDSPKTMEVPDDFKKILAENPTAQAFFAQLDSRNRYAILYQIQNAKKPETRVRRIEKYVKMLNEQKKIY